MRTKLFYKKNKKKYEAHLSINSLLKDRVKKETTQKKEEANLD
jgi:hypothetical protein